MTRLSKPISKTAQNNHTSKVFVIRLLLQPALMVLLIFLISLFSFSQTDKIDSLSALLKIAKEDTTKIITLNDLSWELKNIGDYEKAMQHANDALRLSLALSEGEGTSSPLWGVARRGAAASYSSIGIIHRNKGDYDKALEFYFKSLKIKEEMGDKMGMAVSYNNIGIIHDDKGDYDKALEFYFKGLKIKEEIGDKNGIASSYNNIGTIQDVKGDYDKALEFYFKSLKIYEELGDKKGMAYSYNNISIIHWNKGDYDKALEFYFKSLKIIEELGDKKGMAYCYINIGLIHQSKGNTHPNPSQKEGIFNKALEFYFKSLKIQEEIGDKYGMATVYGNIGQLYTTQKKYNKARSELNKGLTLSKEIGAKDLTQDSYGGLSKLDSTLGNWKAAYEYHKLYSEIKDTIFNEESNKQMTEMQTKYESEKKESQIQLLEKDKEVSLAESKKQRIIIYSVSSGLFLLFILSGVIFRALRNNRKKNKIITKQKQEVEEQKKLVEEQKEEITHKNKDLTDSILYAERIQRAILTSEQYLNDMFLPQQQTASHFILYKPKDIVAGDFYWAYKTPNGKAIWLAADCTGHGVPGAFMSMIGNSLLNEIVIEKGIEQPADILIALRAGIIKAVGQAGDTSIKDGMDCALCCWDKANNKIIFSGANNSLWIIRNNEFIEINPDKQPVGNYTGDLQPFTQKEFELQPGDTLYTFTDGYCDQFGGPKGKKFKYKPFKELIISIQYKSMTQQRIILNETMDKWRGEHEQIDDICVFGVRI